MIIFLVNIAGGLDIKKDNDQPSVHKIRQTFMTDEKFSFKNVTEDIVRKEIMDLDGSKATMVIYPAIF